MLRNVQEMTNYQDGNFSHYTKSELTTSSCKPNKVLVFFDFGTNQNNKLSKLLNSNEYEFIPNRFSPMDNMLGLQKISEDSYRKNMVDFLHDFTLKIEQKIPIFTPITYKLTYFLISNNINFDIIYPNRNVKDWILNEYLESEYHTDYIKSVFGVPDDDLSGKMNYDNLSHLYYNIPQLISNKIMITTPTDIDVAYQRYFNKF